MIVVTGGAGYIGRAIAKALGKKALIVDDFSSGHREGLEDFEVVESDLATVQLDWSRIDAVIHCAGSIQVGESMTNPALYWWNNVGVAAAFFRKVPRETRVVFSSTAAVYGEPERVPIPEEHPLNPVNPYGRTKLAVEAMLRDLGFPLTVFRYFNAAGGDERHVPETHLLPRIIDAAFGGPPLPVYGDGLYVRDFVHVDDLAEAHVRALTKSPGTFNLGRGKGTTVREVIEIASRVLGREVPTLSESPRPGDPRSLVADVSRARNELGWNALKPLEEMIASTCDYRRRD